MVARDLHVTGQSIMSDYENLKSELSLYGVDAAVCQSTRDFYVKKLKNLRGNPDVENDKTPAEETPAPKSISPPTAASATSKVFYGVAVTGTATAASKRLAPFYENAKDVTEALRQLGVEARFKKFEEVGDAIAFSEGIIPREIEVDPQSKEKTPLPSATTSEKNKLRLLVEEGKLKEFKDEILRNPRIIIGHGETPEIVQEGMRRNCLHCATDCGQLAFCQEIINIIRSNDFWKKIYPDISSFDGKKKHMVDLFLNMPDGNNRLKTYETPLHIASKKGFEEIVEFLTSFPETDTTMRNGEGKTAADIACLRAKSDCSKSRIQDLINNPAIYYIPVVTSEYSSTSLGTPSRKDKCLSGQAFAGPLSPVKAKEFYRNWKSPTLEERIIRRSDPDKGLERVGRVLAHREGVGWMEYWDFLGSYCDLSEKEGQKKLELYLSSLSSSPSPIFIAGSSEPSKLDFDVYEALRGATIDPVSYPHVTMWKNVVETFTEEEKKRWHTPKKKLSSSPSSYRLIAPLYF